MRYASMVTAMSHTMAATPKGRSSSRRKTLAWRRRSPRPTARNAMFRTSAPPGTRRLALRSPAWTAGEGGAGRGRLLVGPDEDQHVVEAREVDRGRCVHVLVAPELALDDL